ncbi:MAG: diaminopimelate epimerase [Thermodesulfobacteriota bacterium]
MNEFVKSHGLGNDYIVLDQNKLSFNLSPEIIKLICHRNYGIGSDGILLLTSIESDKFGLRILNPDGSEAEKSGNGLRIFSKYLYEYGYTNNRTFRIDTLGGLVTSELDVDDGVVKYVTVEMGNATFNSKEIPVEGEEREVVNEEIRINGDIFSITALSVGNPHCVIFSDELDVDFIKKVGPLVENNELFPNRINVQIAKVASKDSIDILIWERGAGYTLASGSSSCAVAAAAVKNGLTNSDVAIKMPGGTLNINVREDWSIKMNGPVEEVATGIISNDLISKIQNPASINI